VLARGEFPPHLQGGASRDCKPSHQVRNYPAAGTTQSKIIMTAPRPASVRAASAAEAASTGEAETAGTLADTDTGAGPLSQLRPRTPADQAAAIAASPPALPLITADGLTAAQRKGNSCASCRKKFPRPSVPAGITPAGEILKTCQECVIVLGDSVLPAGAVSGKVPRQ
jgi:hypothetical protein